MMLLAKHTSTLLSRPDRPDGTGRRNALTASRSAPSRALIVLEVAREEREPIGGVGSFGRRALVALVPALLAAAAQLGQPANASSIEVLEDVKGIGSRGARPGDLILFHYVGRLEPTGQVFDSTRGGLTYRDGGSGVLRPAAIALGGGPIPGIVAGLQQALEGMSIGGRRTVRVPPELGFGSQPVLAPYAVVPAGSSLVYDVELLRVSAVGPDQLTKGILKCGAGGANQQAENCGSISFAEFL